jgi:hypothetical protein
VTLEQFKSKYKESPIVANLVAGLKQEDIQTLQARGLVGSASAVVANALYAHLNGNYLFILSDKEEAAYFLMIWKVFLLMKKEQHYFFILRLTEDLIKLKK